MKDGRPELSKSMEAIILVRRGLVAGCTLEMEAVLHHAPFEGMKYGWLKRLSETVAVNPGKGYSDLLLPCSAANFHRKRFCRTKPRSRTRKI